MKKFSTMLLFLTVSVVFSLSASADTLSEAVNDLIVKRQTYDTFLTSEYFNNNRTETQIDTQSGEFVMSQTDYSLPGRNGLDLNITRLYRSGGAARYEMNAIHSGSTSMDIPSPPFCVFIIYLNIIKVNL